ncbi:MAG: hypothetical protein KXJ61_18100 [Hydrogenophaga sp.]|uniref:DUF6988 family protein n=1 Tax=Hydrogenophaga sp. TaxID=1904254 RepID=UPI001D54D476|nr:hypothetical protein [Hydrogenophaga sp.]MBW0172135.1 hypothetical protein [Hydrogenophaga sp.]MBW0186178.1 hypothetical protein [Hydrogenophaga sp.]
MALNTLGRALARADELDEAVMAAIAAEQYSPYDGSTRINASVSAACVALEHGRALRVLIAQGLPTAALSLLRLQLEALTRAVWLLYAATDLSVEKLAAPLSKDTEAAANKLPMLADMLKQLAAKPAAAQPLLGLQAFKDNNAAALNSFVHGGIHALHRYTQGFPAPLLIGAVRNCNGLLLMAGMMLAVLAGNQPMVRRVSRLQVEFAADLPPSLPTHACADGTVS